MNKKEYQSRRKRLASLVPKKSVILIPAAKEKSRNGDSHYRFRQDSDFYYLTGFEEPDALLIISAEKNISILFNRPHHPLEEQWTGPRLGQADAPAVLGVDEAFSIVEIEKHLVDIFANQTAIYYAVGRFPYWEKLYMAAWQQVKGRVRQGVGAPEVFCDLSSFLSELRLIKSDDEIACMTRAADASVAAHQRTMQASRRLKNEFELEAEFTYEILRQGCQAMAYNPIVASGKNACVLHYTQNNQPLQEGELILIDAAGEFNNYAADITRTIPYNGQFNPEQRLIYELVLQAQQAGIACVRPGCLWYEIQQTIVTVLTTGLVELGILKGKVEQLIEQEAYKPFYMHQSGHWLGLDVHDAGQYKKNSTWRALEPGMVLTVEPGLYMGANPKIDRRWWNIGVRIEDDILVTAEGYRNLTGALPVTVEALEALLCDG